MGKRTLTDVFVEKLRGAYDAEKQLMKGLKRLAKTAHAPALRKAFEAHLAETRVHHRNLEEVFDLLDLKSRHRHCDGIAGIMDEARAVTKTDLDAETMDACLIAVAQSAEHYEIAAYGTLVAWARRLQKDDVTDVLIRILDEKKAADEALSILAEDEGVNEAAVDKEDGGVEDRADAQPTVIGRAKRRQSQRGTVSKRKRSAKR
jgi:ferritin-like metal-binding protein YciE